jgi:RNA polymerase sigma-70 factor (ECF subfamily)
LSDKTNIHVTPVSPQDIESAPEKLRELVRECLASKRSAQRQMFEQYGPGVYNVIRRYIFQEEQAKEVLNDVFFKIFTRLNQYSWQGPIEAWMRRIAVNAVTDHVRKYLKNDKVPKVELNEYDAWVDSDAVQNISFKELISYTWQLKETHRTVFNLYVFENLSHKEIAESLNISEGNSRWILNDARKKLKELILRR